MEAHVEGHARDVVVCKALGEELERLYPGHRWLVGCRHDAGTVHVELPYIRDRKFDGYGYLIHLKRLLEGPNALRDRAIEAGGMLLERYGLPRGPATGDSAAYAREHGLDLG